MRIFALALAAAVLLQFAPSTAQAAQRGFLINFTPYVLTLKLQVYGRAEHLELQAHHQLILPNKSEAVIGSVTVNGRTCVASTSLQSSSEVVFEYYANEGRCTFKRWVG